MKFSTPPSDEELIRRFQAGEQSALAELYERRKHEVLVACQRKVRNWGSAQELAQDLFLRLLLKPHSFVERPGRSFAGWLHTVTRNLSLNHLKRFQVSRTVILEDRFPGTTPVFEESLFSNEELLAAMNQLSEKQRLCLKLFYFDEKTYSEIAQITGMRKTNVRSAIQNGKLKLERLLRKDGS